MAAQLSARGFDFASISAEAWLARRAPGPPITPRLVLPEELENTIGYKRFANLEEKQEFRAQLLDTLAAKWGEGTRTHFESLVQTLEEEGSLPLAGLIEQPQFKALNEAYMETLDAKGSQSFLHKFVNLGNHPELLADTSFNGAFLHPLLIALIAHRMGGPIRIVDARGKDAQPISVLAQDNMLHIDNTPFNDEYKVILSWEKGKETGPVGQNFVFLPGTHKGVRAAFDSPKGKWSTENASIFITPESVARVFELQKKTGRDRTVVEATHERKPLTIAFAAGSLVHHRYRTEEGSARSCIIVAFHRVADNKGDLIERLEKGQSSQESLEDFLLAPSACSAGFLQLLTARAKDIEEKLKQLNDPDPDGPELVETEAKTLSERDLAHWNAAVTAAPKVSDVMTNADKRLTSVDFDEVQSIVSQVAGVMAYDKHGPIDLILYADGHEESRKWARNRIREMRPGDIAGRLEPWTSTEPLQMPALEDAREPKELRKLATWIRDAATDAGGKTTWAFRLPPGEKIGREGALRSLAQLADDLGEAIERCDDIDAFVTTSLFLFWTADELLRLLPTDATHEGDALRCSRDGLEEVGRELLTHYIATKLASEVATARAGSPRASTQPSSSRPHEGGWIGGDDGRRRGDRDGTRWTAQTRRPDRMRWSALPQHRRRTTTE